MKKINENTILIIPNNPQKLKQYSDLLIRTFYLSHVEAKDMVKLIQLMLGANKIIVNENLNAIVIRDTPAKIRLAEKIIQANDRRTAEVSLEVEVLEINKTDTLKFGWNFNPGQVTGVPGFGGESGTVPLDEIRDATLFLTFPSIFVDLLKTQSEATILANPKVRVINNHDAFINIGDRVPILISTTTTTAASSGRTPTASTATSTEYTDVGIKLKVKPKIHLNNDVTLEIDLEVSSRGELVDLGPIKQFKFGNRSVKTTLIVKDGETVIIGGLIRDEERNTVNKIPILGDIPFLGKLFSNTEKGKVKTDVLLTITPRIIGGLDTPSEEFQSFWSGTEGGYSTSPTFSGRRSTPGP